MHGTILTLQNPTYLLADVGLPMIFVTYPLMLLALVPVILVEVWVATPKLQGTFGRPAWAIGVANVVSTIIGVPIAWAAMFGVELLADRLGFFNNGQRLSLADVILGSAWTGPPDNSHDWIIPLAAMILLIPTFFVSWYLEAIIVEKMVEPEWPVVRNAMFKANLASYALLFACGCAWLIFCVAKYKPH
jgi:hypothetical protein